MNQRLTVAAAVGALAAAAVVGVSLWSSGDPPETVIATDAEARGILNDTFARLQADPRRDTFCAGALALCGTVWASSGGDAAVPTRPPHVLESKLVDDVRVLVVCGRDGLGRPYRSDFPIVSIGGELRPAMVMFWANQKFEGTIGDDEPIFASGGSTTPPASNPPECS